MTARTSLRAALPWTLLVAAGAAAGCAAFHLPGYAPRDKPAADKAVPGAPAGASSAAGPALSERERNARYYYDLGPETIDVSQYPQKQQADYRVFARVCSQCHTLARAVNSPRSNPVAWDYYVFRMRLKAEIKTGKGYSRKEAKAVLAFLNYDSKVRKGKYRDGFEALSRKLERRFDRILLERMGRLQEANPAPLGGTSP